MTDAITYSDVLGKYWLFLLSSLFVGFAIVIVLGIFVSQNCFVLVIPLGFGVHIRLSMFRCPFCGEKLRKHRGFPSSVCRKCGAS